jgi:hypothetical protein
MSRRALRTMIVRRDASSEVSVHPPEPKSDELAERFLPKIRFPRKHLPQRMHHYSIYPIPSLQWFCKVASRGFGQARE